MVRGGGRAGSVVGSVRRGVIRRGDRGSGLPAADGGLPLKKISKHLTGNELVFSKIHRSLLLGRRVRSWEQPRLSKWTNAAAFRS